MVTRKRLSKELKLGAGGLLEHSGWAGAGIARELGSRRNQLYN